MQCKPFKIKYDENMKSSFAKTEAIFKIKYNKKEYVKINRQNQCTSSCFVAKADTFAAVFL